MRVGIADDAVLFREGLARLVTELGFEVAFQAASVEELDRRAQAGDSSARTILEEAGALAARALAPLARGGRARLVLSGGVASSLSLQRGARESFPGPVVASRFGSFTAAAGAAFATRP